MRQTIKCMREIAEKYNDEDLYRLINSMTIDIDSIQARLDCLTKD